MYPSIIIYYLFAHWVGDFVLQTDEQAKKKSSDIKYLLKHTLTYSLIITFFTYLLIGYLPNSHWYTPLIFGFIQFISHTIIDYVTSRLNKKLWELKETHDFFVSIGFDQFIHYIILFESLWLLFY